MNMTKRQFFSLLTAVALVFTSSVHAAEPVSVVTTTGMIADAAREVGGDLVDVRELMGPGVDPHAYRQTRTDIVALARADLVLWHGLYLEAQMEGLLNDLAEERNVRAVAEGLPKDVLLGHEEYDDKFDPHVWMDPDLWSLVVAEVTDALVTTAPDHRATFEANATAYVERLRALSSYTNDALSSVPETARFLVTAHDAFGYFGRANSFEVVGIQGISTESEAGLRRITEIVDLLVEKNIEAVFVETSVSDRNVRALIEGAAARGHDVRIGGELFSDAMGEAGTYEGTYLGMIDHNATVIVRALGGEAPETGMSGDLGG